MVMLCDVFRFWTRMFFLSFLSYAAMDYGYTYDDIENQYDIENLSLLKSFSYIKLDSESEDSTLNSESEDASEESSNSALDYIEDTFKPSEDCDAIVWAGKEFSRLMEDELAYKECRDDLFMGIGKSQIIISNLSQMKALCMEINSDYGMPIGRVTLRNVFFEKIDTIMKIIKLGSDLFMTENDTRDVELPNDIKLSIPTFSPIVKALSTFTLECRGDAISIQNVIDELIPKTMDIAFEITHQNSKVNDFILLTEMRLNQLTKFLS